MYRFSNLQKKEVPLFIGFLAAIVLGAIYNHWASISATKQGEDDFKNFNSSEIRGVLVDVGAAHHMTGFKVNTSSKEFIFDPKVRGENDFYVLAKKEDSIIKPAFSDTVVLKKKNNDGIYQFTFSKPEPKTKHAILQK
jgi:hypothetical protein